MTRKKIFVLIDNEFVIRNFVSSGSFDELARRHDVSFVFPIEGWRRIKLDPASLPLPPGSRVIRVAIPEKRVWLWRVFHQVHQMRIRFDAGHRHRRKLITGFSHWKTVLLFTLFGLPGIFSIYKRYMERQLAVHDCADFRRLLEDESPDVLVHPSTFEGYFVNDYIVEGQRLGIKTMLVMNSWDNPSLKCAMAGEPDLCVVWGQQTVNHAVKYMGLRRESIRVLGAAQFEIFRQPPRISRDQLCAEHGIDPTHRLVLYAGSSRRAREYEHLRDLSRAIEDGRLPPTTILYRPHPWGGGGADGRKILTEPLPHVVVENSMRPYLEAVLAGAATTSVVDSEYYRTHDILAGVDVLISPLSTIILEGLLHRKPVMCFIPADEAATSSSLGLRVGLDHFAELFRSPAMLVGDRRDSLVELTRQLIARADDPDFAAILDREGRFFVDFPQSPYPTALAELVDGVLREQGA